MEQEIGRRCHGNLECLTKPFFDEAESYDGGGEVMEGLEGNVQQSGGNWPLKD
ncbi:hypothetical protein GGE65_008254 [Skermanella aerolata]|uniref:hypothetical protein n=1 Tax=Skermanella aerolata TaxID=393310 RepID=UPI003D1C8299